MKKNPLIFALFLLVFSYITKNASAQVNSTTRADSTSIVSNKTDQIDWKDVRLTKDPNEVLGLTRVGEVSVKTFTGGGDFGSSRLRKRMQQQAAKMGVKIVFIEGTIRGWKNTFIGIGYK